MLSPRSSFVHRRTYYGTYETICTQCLLTVSSNLIEVELEDDEKKHLCSGLAGFSVKQEMSQPIDPLRFEMSEMRHA